MSHERNAGNIEPGYVWDLLEVLERGPGTYPRFVALYGSESLQNQVKLLFAGLALGPEGQAALRDRLSRRDSAEKWALAVGLGEMGHPDVEGYFARVLRENPSDAAQGTALHILGTIRGPRTLPLVVAALERPSLFDGACAALASYGGAEAIGALVPKASSLAALRALSELGAVEARECFVGGLWDEPERAVLSAEGIARAGLTDLAGTLLPLLGSSFATVRIAAAGAYARLGAPEGIEPLLRLFPRSLPDWMLPALCGLSHPEVEGRLLAVLEESRPRGFWAGLAFWRKRPPRPDLRQVYRALRNYGDDVCAGVLGERAQQETDLEALRELLSAAALTESDVGRSALDAVWGRVDLPAKYLAARALLRVPGPRFLAECLDLLSAPGFRPDRATSPLWDEDHAQRVYADDNGACVLLSALLDSGLVDLQQLRSSLAARLGQGVYSSAAAPADLLRGPADGPVGAFLGTLAAASPSIREHLTRLLNLLAEVENRGDSLLDLFLCSTRVHQGGLQRACLQALPATLGRLLTGKDDRFLPELESIAAHVPTEGPLHVPLRELFDGARRRLMAECRDMAVYAAGSPMGDMVLVEQMRSSQSGPPAP